MSEEDDVARMQAELDGIGEEIREEAESLRVAVIWRPLRTDVSMEELRDALFKDVDIMSPVVGVGKILHTVGFAVPRTPDEMRTKNRLGNAYKAPREFCRIERMGMNEMLDSNIMFVQEVFVLAAAEEGEEPDPSQQEMLPQRGRPSQEVLAAMFRDQTGRNLRSGEREVTVEQRAIAAPDKVISALVNESQPDAPNCLGIQRCVMVDKNGDIVGKIGYDIDTGVYFDIESTPELPTHISRTMIEESRKWINDKFLADFPFSSNADKTIAVLAALTVIQRRMMKIAPGFIFSAPVQSTGKTTLVDIIAEAVLGHSIPASSWALNDEEMEKRLFPMLMTGRQMLLFDNLPEGRHMTSDHVAKAMTSEIFEGRILGSSEVRQVSSLTTIFATGNNSVMKGDLRSRFFPCYLDAKVESPEERPFTRVDIHKWVEDNREECLRHMLIILAGGIRAIKNGEFSPPKRGVNNRFRQWNELVYFPALAAGFSSIEEAVKEASGQDEDQNRMYEFVDSWHEIFGEEPKLLRDVIAASRPKTEGDFDKNRGWGVDIEKMTPDQLRQYRLAEAIQGLTSPRPPDARNLGNAMRRVKNRILGGRRLENYTPQDTKENDKGTVLWRVINMPKDSVPD